MLLDGDVPNPTAAARATKVAIVCGFPRSLLNFRAELLKAMRQAGHQVVAVGPKADEQTLLFLDTLGIQYREISLSRASLSPTQDLRTWYDLHRCFSADKPDCVIAYTIKPVVYGMLAAWSAGVRRRFALITGLGYAFTETGKFSLRRSIARLFAYGLYWISLRTATGVIFQNRDDQSLFRSLRILPGRKRTLVVPGSGIDLSHFAVLPQPNELSVLMIARLVADKGVREFIEASREVSKIHPEVKFEFVGPSDANPSAVSEHEVSSAVSEGYLVYHGEVSDVRPYLANCSIYVLPSYREGMPRSVLEAMACGRAVVTTDVPGCRETVEPGVNGLLVPARSAQALAAAIRTLIEDREKTVEMGRQSRALVERRFDARSVSAQMLQFCDLSAR